ncbi:hypothetical protein OH687_28390 [Burkholderia anthina]|nr:hypothetical protein OH687_28390 [Burkholderia anthina]
MHVLLDRAGTTSRSTGSNLSIRDNAHGLASEAGALDAFGPETNA